MRRFLSHHRAGTEVVPEAAADPRCAVVRSTPPRFRRTWQAAGRRDPLRDEGVAYAETSPPPPEQLLRLEERPGMIDGSMTMRRMTPAADSLRRR